MSEETRQRVIEAAQELGYRVNFLARSLQTNSARLIGVVASNLDTPYRAAQVRVATKELQAAGYTPILVSSDGADDSRGLMERLLNYSVSGMIITSGTPPSSVVEECQNLKVPVVLINRDASVHGADHVLINITKAGQLAFDMLHERQGKSFTVLTPADRTYSVLGRTQAFVAACKAAGYPVQTLQTAGQTYNAGLAASDSFVKAGKGDSVFCANDLLALGFLDGVRHRHGLSVPQDVQLLGFDDIPQASWLTYSLSTIRQSFEEATVDAVKMVLARIEDPARPTETRDIAIAPIHRKTTREIGRG
jgi:DNA-binding LacI/PurR family transcriptional regulator